ncbi:MAG TPA: NUDIX hydrolase [Actinomycetota bacterium]|jgi:ADP-ribose pyrophosphatase|nr:NUDIX hydrolase [Actinomycetota bacterium]
MTDDTSRQEPMSAETVYDGSIFALVQERWPNGEYDVVRHRGAAAVVPVTPDGDVLLVRQFRPAIRQELVEIPAGLLDTSGEDALACAARELFEETGYRHESMEFIGGIYTSAGYSDEFIHLFWARTFAEPEAMPEEGIQLVRTRFAEMAAAARAGRIRDAKTALALVLTARRLDTS